MNHVSFEKICRNCLTSNPGRAIYIVQGTVEEYKKLTEYEFSKILENWMKESNNRCDFCGSSSIEGIKIEIGNYKLYDFDRIRLHIESSGGEFFQWKVVKKQQHFELAVGGKHSHDPEFLKASILKLSNIINNLPEDKLIQNRQMGDLFISFSGEFNFSTATYLPIIDRFYCFGMSRQEVIKCINSQVEKFGMPELRFV